MADKVQGRTYTSNHVKLLKHLDRLQLIQDGKRPSPVMFHMSPCNACNLTCSFCCYANRNLKQMLTLDQAKKAIDSFHELGTRGMEFSVSKDEVVPYYVDGELRVDNIDKVVANQVGSSIAIDDSGNHVTEGIKVFLKHEQKEPLLKVTLKSGRHIKVTKSHSIFFYENNKIVYKPVSDAKEGDLVVVSTKPMRGLETGMDLDYARLLGYFVAEGSFSFQRAHVPHGIHFNFDCYKNEKIYIDELVCILKNKGYNPIVYENDEGNKTTIDVINKKLCEEFLSLEMGDRSNTRRVPNCIFNANEAAQKEFLRCLYAGDGCFRDTIDKGKSRRNVLHLKTSSHILQQTVGFLLQQIGINCSYGEGISPIRYINGRRLEKSKYFYVDIYSKNNLLKLENIIHFLGKELHYLDSPFSNPNNTAHNKTVPIFDDVVAMPIKKIEEVADEEFVYDLSVGDTHRFISSFGILCHNTGGGEPTLHPQFHDMVEYAHKKDFKIGVCTNATTLKKWAEKGTWSMLSWIRLGLYAFTENYKIDIDVLEGLPLTISAAYVWDMNVDTSTNPNVKLDWTDTKGKRPAKNIQEIEDFYRMLDWVEEKKIPTRIAFNAIKSNEQVMADIETIRQQLQQWEIERGRELKFAFLSDFNYKGERRNDHCYMAQVKPCVFTDGNVYTCPSACLATENGYNVNEEFKLCDIDGILDYYNNHGHEMRHHGCSLCKYCRQNELIDDIVTKTEHNDFA